MRIGISGQRYYDADTGRFITEDTYLGKSDEPPSLHRYLYAYSNPTVYIDLEGYYSFEEFKRDSLAWLKKSGNQIKAAVAHPVEAFKGAVKETANLVPRVIKTVAKYGAMDAARSSQEAAGWSSLTGDKQGATEQLKISEGIRKDVNRINVPEFTMENPAQEGGAKIAAGLQIATGLGGVVKGALKGGGKAALRTGAGESGLGDALITGESASGLDVGFETSNLQSKLEGYLLNAAHPQNQTKATWFEKALGFDSSNWQDLASQLKFDEATAVPTKSTQYGQTFEQTIPITGANGNTIDTTFVFMKDNNGVVRFVTGIPAKK